jgi:hypothetical protein
MNWQPIDTAPTDGTTVLGYCHVPSFSKMPHVIGAMSWQLRAKCWWGNNGSGIVLSAPTHWMPLPAPPDLADT